MKYGLAAVLPMVVFAAAADAARIPPRASTHFRIICIVDEKAEWSADRQAANDSVVNVKPQPQTDNSNATLIINSSKTTLDGQNTNESRVEISDKGIFGSGDFPIEIIVSMKSVPHAGSQEAGLEKTITACWKI
jgi:hypothetical protein